MGSAGSRPTPPAPPAAPPAPPQKEDNLVEVTPSDVVVGSCAVITSAAVLAAVYTYRSGSKSLIEDGINPSNRLRMIPVAFQTLMLSTLFTGALGIGGFWALKQAGLFAHDTAELPSAKEAARIIQAPTAYIRATLSKERRQQQEEEERRRQQQEAEEKAAKAARRTWWRRGGSDAAT